MKNRWRASLCGLATAVFASSWAAADYVAYSVDGDTRRPLPERIDDIGAEHLLNIEWGEYSGRRPTVGVLEVENDTSLSSLLVSSASSGADVLTSVPVNGIEAIITDALSRTGRFRLVERQQLQSVLEEQDLSASGRVSEASAARTGSILGADYLVQLVITDYQADTSGKDVDVGGLLRDRVPLLGGLNVKNRTSRVGMNVRLIDAETTEIIFTKQIESVINESGLDFGGLTAVDDLGLGGFVSDFSETPVGQATIAGINQGVYELIKQIGTRPAEGSVVTTNGDQIIINLGAGNAEVGERFQIMQQGEELIDPETGLSLGAIETPAGAIEVVSVQERFSVARLVEGPEAPSRGDKVVSTKAPASLEFASEWSEDY